MIQQLRGNEQSVDAFTKAVGKVITGLRLGDNEALRFEFADGSKMQLVDTGQSCCEARYMRTDDKLEEYLGAILIGAEVASGPNVGDEYGESHETEFLKVQTSKGEFTMVSHVEHNGYYGGFAIEAQEVV
jgi:hypothetical protein